MLRRRRRRHDDDMELLISLFFILYFFTGFVSFLIGTLLTSFVCAFWFSMGIIYTKYSCIDGAENDNTRYYPAFKRAFAGILMILGRGWFSYKILYRPREGKRDEESHTGAKELKEEVFRHLDPMDKENVAIFAAGPHGILAIGTVLHTIAPYKEEWNNVTLFVHEILFKVPFLREICLWLGLRNITRLNMKTEVVDNRRSMYMIPGGVKEMIHDELNPIQDDHKGFLRFAYEYKVTVFPVIHFGQERVFPLHWSCQFLDPIRKVMIQYVYYPFPCIFIPIPFMQQLTSFVLSPLYPALFESEEAFINTYYEYVRKEYATISKEDEEDKNVLVEESTYIWTKLNHLIVVHPFLWSILVGTISCIAGIILHWSTQLAFSQVV